MVPSTFEANFPGASVATLEIRRIGSVVILEVPEISGTTNGDPVECTEALPEAIRPTQWIYVPYLVDDNGTTKMGFAAVRTDGTILFGNQVGSNLAAGNYYVNGFTVTWTIAE